MAVPAGTKESVRLDERFARMESTSSDVFENAFNFKELEIVRELGIYPYYQVIDRNEGPTAIIDGREIVMLGSNNYLGLTTHPEVRQAAIEAVSRYGTSLTGSRLLNGTHKLHIELEEKLAEFVGKEDCLVFTTGYQVNLGILSALLTPGTAVIIDKGDHASIYDGTRLGRGDVYKFNHNDLSDLDAVLGSIPAGVGKMVMVDGVYSMEGDIAPLPALLDVAARHGARVVVDDAHAIGVLGEWGAGSPAHFGVTDKVDMIVGTFSKTLASIGGFAAGPRKVNDFIRHNGRSVLFSASLPPASAAAAMKALEIMKREPERVARLSDNGRYLRESLASLGFNIGASQTPIVPVHVGDEVVTLTLWRELLERGVYVNSIVYPATPRNRSLLRTSVTSEHTREQIDLAVEALDQLRRIHRF